MKKLPPILLCLLIVAWGSLCFAESKFNCRDWMKLTPHEKIALMDGVIKQQKENGIILRLDPMYYARELDKVIQVDIENGNEEGLNASVGVIWHTIAAMEGDWDNGESKLEHAKKWMGEKGFGLFKEMHPEKYRRLKTGKVKK